MTRCLAADDAAGLSQRLKYVTITDTRPSEFDIVPLQGMFQPKVTHHSTDHRALQFAFLFSCGRENEQQLIAVNYLPFFIDHYDPVAITVKSDTDTGFHCRHGLLQQGRFRRTTSVIYVAAIRGTADCDDVRT
jgi:hypothetical protein